MESIPYDKRKGKIWFNGELLTGKMQKSMFLITDCTTQVVSLREKGFMMEKYSDLKNILKDYFIQLKEWVLGSLFSKTN